MKLVIFVLAMGFGLSAAAHEQTGSVRTPQFPLKTARTIYTDEAIATARDNIAHYESAKNLAASAIKAADAWLAWADEDLRAIIPDATVPRAFNVGTAGCPTCGKAIYEEAGTYPWIIDPKLLFKVKCPICNGVFPDNDYAGYYASEREDEACLKGDYADDGWGWVGPNDERYWFIGYANHWILHTHVIPAIRSLSLAYVFTGDARYAHKAAVLLDRAAEVYPHTDYHVQSRYGQLLEEAGGRYNGKFVNLIWATSNLSTMALAYDAVWDTLEGDAALHTLTGRNGEQTRAHIEANLLEEGIDGVFSKHVRGNFGMHQRALVYATLVRQHGDTEAWLDLLFAKTGGVLSELGLNYALYNLVHRDGVPYETAPGYNNLWVRTLTSVAETLRGTAYDAYAIPRTRRLYDGVLDIINAGQFTPALGDSGSVYGGMVRRPGNLQAAYRAFGESRYLAHLNAAGATDASGFKTHASLLLPPIEGDDTRPEPRQTRLLDGYGMAILNNPADTVSMSMYYGFRGGHGHFDRLHFALYANRLPMMPDLGYPDFMNGYVPGIYTWSKNTIAHNTVTVDATRQLTNRSGVVRLFADGGFARVTDVDAADTYPQCDTYRRHLVMIDVDSERSYFVDLFQVDGGGQHDYSLHGPTGTCEIHGGTWAKQEKGTLAGDDVAVAEIYDDATRGKEGYKGTYYGYTGSGFQHLCNVQRLQEGDWFAEWAHEKAPEAKLRIRMLPPNDTETILADAQVSPVKHKELVRFAIARRTGNAGLSSRFASVLEPFAGAPRIESVSRIDQGSSTAVVVTRSGGLTDVVVWNPAGSDVAWDSLGIRTNAATAVVTLDAGGEPLRAFFANGAQLSVGDRVFTADAPLRGEVVAVDAKACQVQVRLDAKPETLPAAQTVAHFENGLRRTAHPVMNAEFENDILTLTTRDDILTGRVRVTEVEAQALRTNTHMEFASEYDGSYIADGSLAGFFPMRTVSRPKGEDSALALVESLPEGNPFTSGEDVWIVNVGPGDRMEIPAVFSWTKEN
ncbi:MAG: hypothetical protein GY851_26325 [bacterium]|nr:hypothetical protein [bacterium]